jgi:hypothetical protein
MAPGLAEYLLTTLFGWCKLVVLNNRTVRSGERNDWLKQINNKFLASRSTW